MYSPLQWKTLEVPMHPTRLLAWCELIERVYVFVGEGGALEVLAQHSSSCLWDCISCFVTPGINKNLHSKHSRAVKWSCPPWIINLLSFCQPCPGILHCSPLQPAQSLPFQPHQPPGLPGQQPRQRRLGPARSAHCSQVFEKVMHLTAIHLPCTLFSSQCPKRDACKNVYFGLE